MGKLTGKKKKPTGGKSTDSHLKQSKVSENGPKVIDRDTMVFINFSQELKDDGNKCFQKRDYEGAMLRYEKALKLLPSNHIDVSYLRSNMAACYMEMGLAEYPRAIHECNLALEVTPRYSKALLKRAKCYEALNRLDLALRDVNSVLQMEANNLMALEIAERVTKSMENKSAEATNKLIDLAPEYVKPLQDSPQHKELKAKIRKKNRSKDKVTNKNTNDSCEVKTAASEVEFKDHDRTDEEISVDKVKDKLAEDKVVVEEKISSTIEEAMKTVKLVFGDDIRLAQLPVKCSLLQLRKIISERFPTLKSVLVKYRDQEGDLITITTDEELSLAESSLRLYVTEVAPDQDPFFQIIEKENNVNELPPKQTPTSENGSIAKLRTQKGSSYIDDWVIEFAQVFKNYVGLDSDAYLNLHMIGMKLYSEAMEEMVTSEEAQDLFSEAEQKFQEMAALALFNWGNVHMSRARKRLYLVEGASRDSVLEQIKTAYEWAQEQYLKSGQKYEEALKIKPDFFEAVLAQGQQQFEQAKLFWHYAIGNNIDLEKWSYTEVIELYNQAENNLERGMKMWEDLEEKRHKDLSALKNSESQKVKVGSDDLFENLSANEAQDQVDTMRNQINILWGTLLYERSIVEFKLELPVWHECLEVAVEKFELAGASPTDIAVMLKNHCSNDDVREGLSFKIDEIVMAWNEMYEAKQWLSGLPSFRLEPLLRRRVSQIYHVLEHV